MIKENGEYKEVGGNFPFQSDAICTKARGSCAISVTQDNESEPEEQRERTDKPVLFTFDCPDDDDTLYTVL